MSASYKKIDTTQPFKISVTTEDRYNPSAITIKIICWITPQYVDDYSKVIKRYSKRLKTLIYNNINRNVFDESRTIVIIDTADKMMNKNKPSYASFNITMYQHKPFKKLKSNDMLEELTPLCDLVMNQLQSYDDFKFSKSK
ncbi:hypothetical protein [Psychroserpens mesophilus]|uniref:hypothetical protein n=1 Tax=Psychroserpens mesophilus TaxID=325473 RepID=UPI003D64682A